MKSLIVLIFTGLATFYGNAEAQAQDQTSQVIVKGDIGKPFTIDKASFSSFKMMQVKVKSHDGIVHEYSGISLFDIITKAEAVPDGKLRGKSMAKFVLITAADQYQVVIALPEFNPVFTDQIIILANKEDGKNLAPEAGTYQLIVPGDKKPARWVRQVNSIQIKTAKSE